ncbi:MAG: 16S rRNA (guanine(966)-N(2))-methyltransferase RsmD [Anaerolineae bacterium]
MRVVGGKAKGRRLLSVPGEATRPIADRVKTALFDILADRVRGARVLDLFAGTGSVGIEALSRGAARVVFVDRSPRAVRVVCENLRRTALEEGAQVVRGDAFRYLSQAGEAFDLIYVAPPQYRGLWKQALTAIEKSDRLALDGEVIVQIHPKEFEPLALKRLQLLDRRRYGSTLLCFYAPRGSEGAEVPPWQLIQGHGEAEQP